MGYDPFVHAFGQAREGTGLAPAQLKLERSEALVRFASEVGGGVFADGLISVLSVREQVDSLGGWEQWLPADARLFGTSAFGSLLATGADSLWIVDTQYGQVVESDLTVEELLNELASPEGRAEDLRAPLFESWNQLAGPLDPRSVLCPTPALPLGGQWSLETLAVMTLPVYLSFTGQLFEPHSGMPAEVRRLQ